MNRAILLGLCLTACAHAPNAEPASPPRPSLDDLELARSLGGGELLRAAQQGSPDERRHALVVIGRLQRPESVDAVVAALGDPAVMREAAFAAGQLGLAWQPLEKPHLEKLAQAAQASLAKAPDAATRAALVNALGKLSQPLSGDALVAQLADADPGVRREAGQALGILAYATKGAAPALEHLDAINSVLAHDPDPEVRYAAGYALMRLKKPEARAGLTFGLKDGDGRVRAVCARGLGDVGTDAELAYLLERLGDKELDVRVESARSLGKLASRCDKPGCPAAAAAQSALLVLAASYDPARPDSGMPLLALVQEKLPASMGEALTRLQLAPAQNAVDAHGRTVLACYVAAAADHTRVDARTPALNACKPVPSLAAWRDTLIARTLADTKADPKARVTALLALAPTSPAVEGAVDDALGELKLDTPEVRTRVLADLQSPDWGIALSAADAAGKLGLADALPGLVRAVTLADVNKQDDALATVLGHLATLKAPQARAIAQRYVDDPRATVRAGALEALKTLGAEARPEPRPLEARLVRSPNERQARIVTERGEVRLRLHANSFTAQNFITLAQRGYFDELTFHRVVPGFVVQGGDPRGDGSGGPGYELPCELDRSRYVRGAVGMALAGKDTGGSQFFITLAPQPHLEGKYTIFADVVSGMEIADQLMEGDRIVRVEVEP